MSNTTAQGAITAAAQTVPATGSFVVSNRDFKLVISGTFTGAITLQEKNRFSGEWVDVDTFTAPVARNGFSADRGGEYRAIANTFTSGTANVMLAAPNDY